jgi:hypothetical protein
VSTEGTTFYTLDVITGNVIFSADVEAAATAAGVNRTGLSYANALVAGPASFSPGQLSSSTAGHPSDLTDRVFIGDLHGRLWKFLSKSPDTPILMADLGQDQPVGVPPALLAFPPPPAPLPKAYIYIATGNDRRVPASTVFKIFGFRDEDTSSTDFTPGTRTVLVADSTVFVYPNQSSNLFVQTMPTDAGGNSLNFRGTIQPATAFTDTNPPLGRVIFGGTRFNGFLSTFAPTPYPCLATFDSVIFALGATTGGAAYDLNASGQDAYTIFSNSRKLAIQILRQPAASSSSTGQQAKLFMDEGLMSSGTSPNPPSPPGFAPLSTKLPPTVALYTRSAGDNSVFPQYSSPRLCGQ